MKKTLMSLLLVVVLAVALAVPAMADEVPAVNTAELLTSAINAQAGSETPFVQLTGAIEGADNTFVISNNLYLDLNGKAIEGTIELKNGAKLYLLDSATSDYDVANSGCGSVAKIVVTDGEIVRDFVTPGYAANNRSLRYITIKHTGKNPVDAGFTGYTTHRIYIGVTHTLLRPDSVAVDYRTAYLMDEILLSYVQNFGGMVDVKEASTDTLLGTVEAEVKNNPLLSYANGTEKHEKQNWRTIRVENFLGDNTEEWANNTVNRKAGVTAYVRFADGFAAENEAAALIESSPVAKTFQSAVAAAQKQAATGDLDTTQNASLTKMFENIVEKHPEILDTWSDNTETKFPYHCECGSATETHLEGCDGVKHLWKPWSGTTMPNQAGYWYMTDATVNYTTGCLGEFNSGGTANDPTLKVAVDLYGKTINVVKNNRAFVFGKLSKAELTITDSVGGGKLVTAASTNADQGIMLWNRGALAGVLNIYGGTLDASATSTTTSSSYGGQGAFEVTRVAVNMAGGVVKGQNVDKTTTTDGKTTYAGNGGAFYLASGASLTVSGNAKIYGGNVGNLGGAVSISSGCSMTIKDNAEIIGATSGNVGGAVYVGTNATLTIQGKAKIRGGQATHGGNIFADGTVIMDNGLVAGGSTTTGSGGNIYVAGTLTMNNGTISGGAAAKDGGNVNVAGTGAFTMNKGTVTGGSTTGGSGGNICVNKTFTMNDGLITLGTSGTASSTKHGGGIYAGGSSSVTINGGSITNNTATIGGGGIYTNNALTINGGTITGNHADAGQSTNTDINVVGGDVVMSGGTAGVMAINNYKAAGSITVSGKPVIHALTLSNTDASDTEKYDFPAIQLAEGKTLQTGTSIAIVINKGTVSKNGYVVTGANAAFADYADYFRSVDGTYTAQLLTEGDNANKLKLMANYYCLCATKTSTHLEGCDGTKHEWKAWDMSTKTTLPNTDGYWYLTGTAADGVGTAYIGTWAGESATATGSANVAIDLRGIAVTAAANSRAFALGQLASVTLSFADSVGGGSITAGAKTGADQGIIVWNRGTTAATVNLFGGTFDARPAVSDDSGAYGGQGAFDMTEGDTVNISGNTVIYGQPITKGSFGKGGAINFRTSANWVSTNTLTISGNAKIYGSTVSAFGGAICTENAAAITIKDNAEIIGGTAAVRGGAIYMSGGGTLTMSGNAKIRDGQVVSTLTTLPTTGNTGNSPYGGNIYCVNGTTITMSDNATISGGVVDAKSGNNHGGNLFMNGSNEKLIMSGNAKITGGNAKNGQGGNMYTNGTITMSGNAEITGGKLNTNATASNADVFAVNAKAVSLSGSAKIGYIASYCDTATSNTITLAGEPVIEWLAFTGGGTADKNVFTKIAIDGTLGDKASIGLNVSVPIKAGVYEFTTETVKENADKFTAATKIYFLADEKVLATGSDKIYCVCGASKTGATHKPGCDGSAHMWKKWDGSDFTANTTQYLYVESKLTPSQKIVTGNTNIYIDLNGQTVASTYRAFQFKGSGVANVVNYQNLTITDTVGTGVWTAKAADSHSQFAMNNRNANSVNAPAPIVTITMFGGHLDLTTTTARTSNGSNGAIDIGAGATITMNGGKITGTTYTGTTYTVVKGGAIYLRGGSKLIMNGDAQIIGGSVSDVGGAVYVDDAASSVVLNDDAKISGGNANNGGSIYLNAGTLTVKDRAVVTSGVATTNGGVIYMNNGTFNMQGGTINGGNTAQNSVTNAVNGGCLYVNAGTVNMSAGTITGGAVAAASGSTFGGNVYNNGTFNMSGTALITEGKNNGGDTNSHGANVSTKGGTFKMSGDAKVTNGHANKGQGGNIHVTATLNISENAEITGGQGVTAGVVSRDIFCVNGKVNMDGGHIASIALTNTDTSKAAACLSVKGAAKADFVNLSKTSGTTYYANMSLAGALTEGACIKINAVSGQTHIAKGNIADDVWASYANYVTEGKLQSANASALKYTSTGIVALGNNYLCHCICGSKTETHLTGCDGTEHIWTPWTGSTLPNTAGYWVMTDASKTYSQTVISGNNTKVYIDLNGKTINYALRAFRFDTSSTAEARESQYLTITDSVGGGSLNLTSSFNNHSTLMMAYKNGKTFTPKVTFTMYGGHLNASQANVTSQWGSAGAINAGANATIKLYGGKITGQTVNGYGSTEADRRGTGGAVYLIEGSSLIVSDEAEIVGSSVAQYGGAIYVNDAASSVEISGNAKVSGGSAVNGGTIYLNAGTLTVKGNASVSGGVASGNGGVVYMKAGTFNMEGGILDGGNTAEKSVTNAVKGGVVYMEAGNLNMSGDAMIQGGSVTTNAGGVYVQSGTLDMIGNATITGNKVTGNTTGDTHGGNVFVGENGKLTMSGDAKITNGSAMNPNTYVEGTTTKHRSAQGGNIYTNGILSVSGNASITGGACDTGADAQPITSASNADVFVVGAKSQLNVSCGTVGRVNAAGGVGQINLSGSAKVAFLRFGGTWIANVTDTLDSGASVGFGCDSNVKLVARAENCSDADWGKIAANVANGYFTTEKAGTKIVVEANGIYMRPSTNEKGEVKYHCVCGANNGTNFTTEHLGDCDGTVKTWSAWTATTMPTTAGNWYLAAASNKYTTATVGEWKGVTATAESPALEIAVDLNGKSITMNSGNRIYSIGTLSKFTVTITDSVGGGKVTSSANATGDQAILFWNRSGLQNNLNLYNVALDASAHTNNSRYGGQGAVDLGANAVINLYGNTVVKGMTVKMPARTYTDTKDENGKNVTTYVDKLDANGQVYYTGQGGTFYLRAGSVLNAYDNTVIEGGTVAEMGGAIYMVGGSAVTLNDNAKVQNGKVEAIDVDGNINGGNIYVSANAVLTLNDNAQVLNGSAVNTYDITNGEGKRITSAAYGGNIFLMGILEINDNAKIIGGSCEAVATDTVASPTAQRADIYLWDGNARLSLSDSAQVGYIGIYGKQSVMQVGGAAKITSLYTTWPVAVTSALTEAASINFNVTTDNVLLVDRADMTDEEWAVYADYLSSGKLTTSANNIKLLQDATGIRARAINDANGNPIVYQCLCTSNSIAAAAHPEGCDGAAHAWTAWTNTKALPTDTGYYYLTANVTTSGNNIGAAESYNEDTAAESKNIAIDLNGKTVNGSSAHRVFVLGNCKDTTLTITDSVGGGVITTKNCSDGTKTVDQGAFLWNRSTPRCTVNIFGGTIDASKSDTNTLTQYGGQGAIDIGSMIGTGHVLNIANATIKGQNISKNVKVNKTESGLEVTTDPWGGHGGAIYVNNTTVNISNGANIVGGNVSGNGSAIYVSNGTVNIIGATVTGGNSAKGTDIYTTNTTVNMDGAVSLNGTVSLASGKAVNLGDSFSVVNGGFDILTNLSSGCVARSSEAVAVACEGKITANGEALEAHATGLYIPTDREADTLYVGFAETSVDPTPNQLTYAQAGYLNSSNNNALPIMGYGTNKAGTSLYKYGNEEHGLYANAIAFADNEAVTIMISVDGCSLGAGDSLTIRKQIGSSLGIPYDNIIISATHAHSSPALSTYQQYYELKTFNFLSNKPASDAVLFKATSDGLLAKEDGKLVQITAADLNLSWSNWTAKAFVAVTDLDEAYKTTYIKGVVQAAIDAYADMKAVTGVSYATVSNVNDSGTIYNSVRNHVASVDGVKVGMSTPNHISYDTGVYPTVTLESESDIDDDLQLVKYTREGQPDIILANFQCHPLLDSSSTKQVLHSDVPGGFRYALESKLENTQVVYFSGASGNVSPYTQENYTVNGVVKSNLNVKDTNGDSRKAEEWGDGMATMAAAAQFTSIENFSTKVSAVKRSVTYDKKYENDFTGTDGTKTAADRYALAVEIQKLGIVGALTNDKVSSLNLTQNDLRVKWGIYSSYHVNRIVSRYPDVNKNGNLTGSVDIYAIAVGDISFTGSPYEMFDSNGKDVKTGTVGHADYAEADQKTNPFAMTIVTSCANGASGYIPNKIGFINGGYSSDISPFAAGTGEQLVTNFLDMLNGLYTAAAAE